MRLLLLIFTCVIGLSGRAHASLLIEPYVGTHFGELDTKNGNNSGALSAKDNADQFSGFVFGGRFGLSIPLLFIAADYLIGNGSVSMPATKDTLGTSSLWGVLGLHVPLIRLWVGYAFHDDFTDHALEGDDKWSGGNAYKAGVSFTGLPVVAINAEYIVGNYSKYRSPTVDESVSSTTTYASAQSKTVLVTISLPFEL